VRFSLGDPYKCVLGQLFGNYYDAANELGLSKAQQSNFGFMYWGSGYAHAVTRGHGRRRSWVNLEASRGVEEIA
jgi:hypothetical protein